MTDDGGSLHGPDIVAPHSFGTAVRSAGVLYASTIRVLFGSFALAYGLGVLTSIAGAVAAARIGGLNAEIAVGFFIPVVAIVTFMGPAVALGGIAMARAAAGGVPDAGDARTRLRGRGRDLVQSALLGALIALCFAALLGPLVHLFIPLFFGPPVVAQIVAFEGGSLQDSLARAWALLKGHRLRVLGALFTVALGIGLVQLIAATVTASASGGLPRMPRAAVFFGSTVVIAALLLPYQAAVALVSYFDLRARADSFDAAGLRAELD